jgi:hypothetical protein
MRNGAALLGQSEDVGISSYRYIRVNGSHSLGSTSQSVQLSLFEAYESEGGPNILTGGTASGSNEIQPASNAFDGSFSTYWSSNVFATGADGYIQYDLGLGNEKTTADLYEVSLWGFTYGNISDEYGRYFETYTIDISLDGSNWFAWRTIPFDVHWVQQQVDVASVRKRYFSSWNPVGDYRYVRLYNNSVTTRKTISSFEVYEGATNFLTGGSGVFTKGATNPASLFDENTSTQSPCWTGLNAYRPVVQYDLGEGNERNYADITQVGIRSGTESTRLPNDLSIEFSLDQQNWTVYGNTGTSFTTTNQWNYF